MEDLFKTVEFHMPDDEITTLELGFIRIQESQIEIRKLMDHFKDGCIVKFPLDIKEASVVLDAVDCLLLNFDWELGFCSFRCLFERIGPRGDRYAPPVISIHETYLVILPVSSELSHKSINFIHFSGEEGNEDEASEDEFDISVSLPEVLSLTLTDDDVERLEETAIPLSDELKEASRESVSKFIKPKKKNKDHKK